MFFHLNAAAAQDRAPGAPPEEIAGKTYREYLNSQDYFDLLAKEVLAYEAGFGPCREPRNVARKQVGRPQVPMSLPKLGVLPQWMEVLQVTGCGRSHSRSVLVIYHNSKVRPLPIVPGRGLSRFDIILQRDVLQSVIKSERAYALRTGCEDDLRIAVLSTKVLSREEKEDGYHWSEAWTISNCKGEKKLTVTFDPDDGGGTHYSIRQPGAN